MFLQDIKRHLPVYLVTDLVGHQGKTAAEIVAEAIEGGVSFVQLREKQAPLPQVLEQGRIIRELCLRRQVPFVVNDRVDVALLLDADGVHVGQEDIPGAEARRLLGPGKIVGISAGSLAEAEIAVAQGADYIGVGPVYATATKGDAGAPIGTALIETIRARWPELPLVGIGGIQPDNAAPVVGAGADGVAVVSAITKQADPKEAAERLRRSVTNR